MKILIAGGSGRLGTECREVLGREHEVIAPDKKSMNIISWDKVIENLEAHSPDVVINCAGITELKACEEGDPYLTAKINVEGTRNLAQCCGRYDCKFVHISCALVFDGSKKAPQPYFEDDPPYPLSTLAKHKIESEVAVRSNAPDYLIVRTSWIYGSHGEDFITSLVRQALMHPEEPFRLPDDEVSSPTWTYRLVLQIMELIRHDLRGTFHAAATGICSRFEWGQRVLKGLGLKTNLEPCHLAELEDGAIRPLNSILENRQAKAQEVHVMADWKKDLDFFLENYGKRLVKRIKSSQRGG